MADDLSVVNSARVSFLKHKNEVEDEDALLINFLMKNRHGTPFEHNAFRFHVKCPIFVAREWMRHRIGSYNEWSARYSQLVNEFYIPAPEQIRVQTGKPGHYTYEPHPNPEEIVGDMEQLYEMAFTCYKWALDNQVAKEIARLVLPVAIYTQFYWTVNARSLMNFLSLRNSDMAMWEIRQYAIAIESIFNEKMPLTCGAFVNNNRVAP